MKDVVIGIIGGTGGMGRWFAELMRAEGYPVHCAGRRDGMRPEEMTRVCDVVVISVPIDVTCAVIAKVGPHMSRESLLMDLTSLKEEPVRAMLNASGCEVIGCHPLFGPAITRLEGYNVVLCPARSKTWFPWLKDIFLRHRAAVTVASPEEHDRMMAVVQVLNHLHTIHLGMMIGQENRSILPLQPWSTPVFEQKLEMIRKVFQDQPDMYAEIMVRNAQLERICTLYRDTFELLEKAVRTKDSSKIINIIDHTKKKLWPKP